MILKEVLKCLIKLGVVFAVLQTAEAIIPFDSRGQSTPGNIGRSDKDLAVIAVVKDICFGMK